jgi:hypothetical protein
MPRRDDRIRENLPEARARRQIAEATVAQNVWDREPLKQYVRRFGWLEIIQNYQRHRNEAGMAEPLKILTLPGENATDIGLLWSEGVITRDDQGKLNVAICDDSAAEKVVSNLSKLGSLLAVSGKPLIEALQNEETLIEQFPFDVINLDLTTHLIPEKRHVNERAIDRIFRLQRGQSFLLLLTTRSDINDPTRENLLQVLNHNLEAEPRFHEAYRNRYGGINPQLCLNNLVEFVQIIYPKILARYSRYYGYKVAEHFVADYRGNRAYTMVCHSLEFEPLARKEAKKKYEPRIDRVLENEITTKVYGEFSTAHQRMALDAYVDFIEYLPTRRSRPIDQILHRDPALNTRMTEEANRLMNWWVVIE